MDIRFAHRYIAVLLSFCLILTLSSLIITETAGAPTIPKPSVPEFTVNLVDSSYETEPTATINPYTGQTVTNPSQHVEARTIQIKIKYTDFTPFEIQNESNSYTVNLHYNIRWKGYFETEWHELYIPMNGYAVGEKVGDNYVVSYQGTYSPTEGLILDRDHFFAAFPPDSKIDFQVEALIGYINHVVALPVSAEVFEGETSGWSSTQTLSIGDISVTPTASPVQATIDPSDSLQGPSVTPVQSNVQSGVLFGLGWEQVAIVGLSVAVIVLLVFVLFYLRRRSPK